MIASAWSRFLEGLRLPLDLGRALRADAEARAYYRSVVLVQASVTVVVGAALAVAFFALVLSLADTDKSSVTWSPEGVTFHSGNAPEVKGEPLDDDLVIATAFAYVLFFTLTLVEGLVIVLSREFHDQIGRRAALLRGIPPEDPETRPRVRLNVRWMWTKIKRKLRGARVFAAGLPLIALLGLVPVAGSYLYTAVAFSWSVYWLTVFAGAKSALAWHDEHTVGDPFFLRAASRVPVLKWYARLWRRLTRALFAPCRRVEEAPFELAGLAVARVIGSIPVLYLFFRPFLPVAAAAIIARRRGDAGPAQAELGDAPLPLPRTDNMTSASPMTTATSATLKIGQ